MYSDLVNEKLKTEFQIFISEGYVPASLTLGFVRSGGMNESICSDEAFSGKCFRIGTSDFLRAMSVKLRSRSI